MSMTARPEIPPDATLAELASDDGPQLVVISCAGPGLPCSHSVKMQIADLRDRFGGDKTVPDILPLFTCQKCGHKGAVLHRITSGDSER